MLRRVLSTALAPTIIIAAGLAAFFWLKSNHAPPERTRNPPRPPVVETMVFAPKDSRFEIKVGGNVVPSREASISAQVAGVVISKAAELRGGRFVKGSTSLLQIDPANYELEVRAIGSELKQVEEDLRRIGAEVAGNELLIRIAEGKLKLATQELSRVKALVEKNAAAEAKLEEAQLLELQASDALQVLRNVRDLLPIRRGRLEAEQKLTELRRQLAQLDLDRTSVAAPFDGIVTKDEVELGDFVQPGDPLLTIAATASVEVECNLRTEDLYWLWNSQRSEAAQQDDEVGGDRGAFEVPRASATITFKIGDRVYHWEGVLARYEGSGIDPTTRTAPCRVVVTEVKRGDGKDGPPTLMQGMYVTVALAVVPRVRLWRIPHRAVQPNGQIWTIKQGKLHVHAAEPARVLPDAVLIRAEATQLQPGDRLIVSQLSTAFDGMLVRESEPTGAQ